MGTEHEQHIFMRSERRRLLLRRICRAVTLSLLAVSFLYATLELLTHRAQ